MPRSADIARPTVLGLEVDPQTRCRHWHSSLDVVAIKMPCCDRYWACIDCHAELADHPPVRRSVTDPAPAILCGVCNHEMTVGAYLACDDVCPACQAPFNPGCRLHRDCYFKM